MSTREKSMKKLQEEFDKHVEIRTEYKAGRRSSDAHPDQSLLAENARLKSFLGKLASRIGLDSQSIKFEAVWGDPKNIQTHLELCQKNMERWFIEIKEALSQSSPPEEYVRLSDVMPLVEAAREVQSFEQRAFGDAQPNNHLSVIIRGLLSPALAAFEKAKT